MKYQITLHGLSPLLAGGHSHSMDADRCTAVSWHGTGQEPFIPAKAIKGAMRTEFEKLLRGSGVRFGIDICSPGSASACQPGKPCLVCSIFGQPAGTRSKLRFASAHLRNQQAPSLQPRLGNAISRQSRTTVPDLLFDELTAPAGLDFVLELVVQTPLTSEEQTYFERALDWWQATGLRLGSRPAAGTGWFSLTYQKLAVVEPAWPVANPVAVGPGQLYDVTFVPRDTMRISAEKSHSYHMNTLGFIPGSTMAGAIAQALPGASLDDLFSRRPIAISHLYLGGFGGVLPATGRICKVDADHKRHDVLLHLFLLKLAIEQKNGVAQELAEKVGRCPVLTCGAPTRPVESTPQPALQLRGGHTRNRTLRRAETGFLYNQEVMAGKVEGRLEPSTLRFGGMLYADPVQASAFQAISEVSVGGNVSIGSGRGTLTIRQHQPIDPNSRLGYPNHVSQRVTLLNQTLRRLASVHDVDLSGDRTYFTLDLLTDLLLLPCSTVTDLLGKDWKLEFSCLSWCSLGGYQQSANMKKPLVRALARGGVLLLSTPAKREVLCADLAQLEQRGWGIKREDGFGWVQSCRSQHYAEVAE